MGHLREHAIVVSGELYEHLDAAHKLATAIFPWVSPISPKAVNGNRAFFIPPDGSKEGWRESIDGDNRRAAFKDAMRDAGNYSAWVEVMYGDDYGTDAVVVDDDRAAPSPIGTGEQNDG
ncbi:MAG: hypothetical protein RIA64_07550 [Rhodospirillales bacterium]